MSNTFANDPFQEFITDHLNLEELEGVSLETVVSSMRETLATLAVDPTDNLWADHLTSIQDMIRLCLSMDMVLDLLHEKPNFAGTDRADLELLIMLSVTVGFVCQNQMNTQQSDLALEAGDLLLARRMRTLLKSSLGWVRKAADEGDPVAAVMLQDATDTISDTTQFE